MSFDGFAPPPPARTIDELARSGFRRYTELRRRHRVRQVIAIALVVLLAGASVPLLLWRNASVQNRLVDRPAERKGGVSDSEEQPARSEGLGRTRKLRDLPSVPGIVPGDPGPGDDPKATATDQIAFVRHRTTGSTQLFIMNGDGSSTARVTDGSEDERDPDWSPDGRRIVLTADGDLQIIDLDRGRATTLAITGARESAPSWSPDARRIAFSQENGEGLSDIYVMNVDGTGLKNLTRTPELDEYTSSWSPDGRRMVFALNGSNQTGIYVMNADGSRRKRLTSGQDLEPEWSPDGSKTLFTRYETASATPSDIYVMRSDGSGQRNLTNSAEVFEYAADWSPDGKRIAFTRDPDGRQNPVNDPFANAVACTAARVCTTSQSAIYVMRSDGSSPAALTAQSDGDESPAYQPRKP